MIHPSVIYGAYHCRVGEWERGGCNALPVIGREVENTLDRWTVHPQYRTKPTHAQRESMWTDLGFEQHTFLLYGNSTNDCATLLKQINTTFYQ